MIPHCLLMALGWLGLPWPAQEAATRVLEGRLIPESELSLEDTRVWASARNALRRDAKTGAWKMVRNHTVQGASDAGGAFRIGGLLPGIYWLTATKQTADGGEFYGSRGAEAAMPLGVARPYDLIVRNVSARKLRVKLLQPSGEPAPGVSVALCSNRGNLDWSESPAPFDLNLKPPFELTQSYTDQDGQVSFLAPHWIDLRANRFILKAGPKAARDNLGFGGRVEWQLQEEQEPSRAWTAQKERATSANAKPAEPVSETAPEALIVGTFRPSVTHSGDWIVAVHRRVAKTDIEDYGWYQPDGQLGFGVVGADGRFEVHAVDRRPSTEAAPQKIDVVIVFYHLADDLAIRRSVGEVAFDVPDPSEPDQRSPTLHLDVEAPLAYATLRFIPSDSTERSQAQALANPWDPRDFDRHGAWASEALDRLRASTHDGSSVEFELYGDLRVGPRLFPAGTIQLQSMWHGSTVASDATAEFKAASGPIADQTPAQVIGKPK